MLETVNKMSMYEVEKLTSVMRLFHKHSYLIVYFLVDFPKSMSSVLLYMGLKCMAVKMKYFEKKSMMLQLFFAVWKHLGGIKVKMKSVEITWFVIKL